LQQADTVGRFLAEACIEETDAHVRVSALHDAYTRWCRACGETPCGMAGFSQRLQTGGFQQRRNNKGKAFLGLRLAGDRRS